MSTLALFPSREAGLFGRRLKRTRGTRIPVYVVTGFLGAGKTTLVREFLKAPEGANTAVVVNEFGAVGIDDALVRSSADETVLLGNGCVCCNTRSDLQVALRGLVADRERGAVPHFRRILIETSGLADPGPILQTFTSDRALAGEFHVETVVALIDAVSARDTLEWSAEARKQVILADMLVITKTDLADPPQLERVMDRLTGLNPHAVIGTAANGVINSQHLFADRGDGPTAHDRNPFLAEAAHSDGIGSFVWTEASPISWETFSRAMETMAALRGPDLLRAKGFLDVVGCAGPVVVQIVQHLMHTPVELQEWPGGNRATRVVFITRNIPERAVRDLLEAVRALANERDR